MRLIDADALAEDMYQRAFETDTPLQRWDGGCWIRYKMFEIAIKEAPTIKPKKGKWIKQDDEECWWYECSVCGDYPLKNPYGNDVLSDFCPNCGADMRGEE